MLGNWQVTCRLPVNHSTVRRVIGPIGPDYDVKQLLGILSDGNTSITEANRLTTGKDKTPTLNVVLTFNVPDMSYYVYLYQ